MLLRKCENFYNSICALIKGNRKIKVFWKPEKERVIEKKSFLKIWKKKIFILGLSAKAILGFEGVKTALFALLTWGMWCPLFDLT